MGLSTVKAASGGAGSGIKPWTIHVLIWWS